MQRIETHFGSPLNNALVIEAIGSPGAGGAHTAYLISGDDELAPLLPGTHLQFQSGPCSSPEDFIGITNEALLAVLIHRLEGFQSGPFACDDNAECLTRLKQALHCLHMRSMGRMNRGVEGTVQP